MANDDDLGDRGDDVCLVTVKIYCVVFVRRPVSTANKHDSRHASSRVKKMFCKNVKQLK